MVKPVKATKNRTIAVVCGLALGLSAGCSVFTAGETVSEPDITLAKATRAAVDAKQREERGLPAQPGSAQGAKQAAAPVPEVKETVTAAHILIAYQGARAASTTTTRSKEQ